MEKQNPVNTPTTVSENPSSVLVNVALYTIVTIAVGALTLFLIR